MMQTAALDFAQARHNMVQQQIRPWDVLSDAVLSLLERMPREAFVPAAYRSLAYADLEIPLGEGQVMLPPRLEARLLQALDLSGDETVLEIGAGSGYMAALLGRSALQVTALELRAGLAEMARSNLARAGLSNVQIVLGDGAQPGGASWAEGHYDAILFSGSVPQFPRALCACLKPAGRLLAICGAWPQARAWLGQREEDGAIRLSNLFDAAAAPLEGFAAPDGFTF